MIGESDAMLRLQRMIAKVARRSSAVLITGESGTGKELVARAIHNASHRTPFVPVDCGSLPASLVESELFGYVQGAFTGAVRAKSGLFQAANGGTLFLDEVGELPRELQPKLLRALQQGEVRPIGATRGTAVDVRVIAATHRDLREEVAAKRFREDLYFRLAVVTLRVPALRDRPEDIPLLARHFAACNAGPGFDSTILPDAMELLVGYDWPGNVRELENALERAVALNTNGPIRKEDLPTAMQSPARAHLGQGSRGLSMADAERRAIEHALHKANNNKLEAARLLGIGKTTLYRKLREYAIPEGRGNSQDEPQLT
jgi:DNA-binding NtrC family response regulator